MQKKTNVKKPDRVILFEIGIIVALLFVNLMLNIEYKTRTLLEIQPESADDSWEIQSHKAIEITEDKEVKPKKSKIEEAIIFDPSAIIKQVDDLFKTPDLQLKPKLPAGLKLIKPLIVKAGPDTSSKVDDFPEIRPEFPGGETALRKYIASNFNVPDIVMETQNEVKMIVEFIINKKGEVYDFKVLNNSFPNKLTENAAANLYDNMPLWKPGQNKNGVTNTRMRQPIRIVIH